MDIFDDPSNIPYEFSNNIVDFEDFKTLLYSIENGTACKQSFINYTHAGGRLEDEYFYICRYTGEIYTESIPMITVEKGNLSLLKSLIKLKPDLVNFHNGHINILSEAIQFQKYDMADYLINNGADVNDTCHRNKTAIYYAIINRNAPMVKKLIENGADIEIIYSTARLNSLSNALYEASFYVDRIDPDKSIDINQPVFYIVFLLIISGAKLQHPIDPLYVTIYYIILWRFVRC